MIKIIHKEQKEASHILSLPLAPLPFNSPKREDMEFHSYKSFIRDNRESCLETGMNLMTFLTPVQSWLFHSECSTFCIASASGPSRALWYVTKTWSLPWRPGAVLEKKFSLALHGNRYRFLSGNSGKAVCILWFPRVSRSYRRQSQAQVRTLEISGGKKFRKLEPWDTQKQIGGEVSSVPSNGRWALSMAGRPFPQSPSLPSKHSLKLLLL